MHSIRSMRRATLARRGSVPFTFRKIPMGLIFRKSFSLGSFLRVNVSKSGLSVSVGPKGCSLTLGPRGATGSAGLPGTGLSYRTKVPLPGEARPASGKGRKTGGGRT